MNGSLIAITSTSSRSWHTRSTRRPMRPKPLMATFVFGVCLVFEAGAELADTTLRRLRAALLATVSTRPTCSRYRRRAFTCGWRGLGRGREGQPLPATRVAAAWTGPQTSWLPTAERGTGVRRQRPADRERQGQTALQYLTVRAAAAGEPSFVHPRSAGGPMANPVRSVRSALPRPPGTALAGSFARLADRSAPAGAGRLRCPAASSAVRACPWMASATGHQGQAPHGWAEGGGRSSRSRSRLPSRTSATPARGRRRCYGDGLAVSVAVAVAVVAAAVAVALAVALAVGRCCPLRRCAGAAARARSAPAGVRVRVRVRLFGGLAGPRGAAAVGATHARACACACSCACACAPAPFPLPFPAAGWAAIAPGGRMRPRGRRRGRAAGSSSTSSAPFTHAWMRAWVTRATAGSSMAPRGGAWPTGAGAWRRRGPRGGRAPKINKTEPAKNISAPPARVGRTPYP
eukprot:scaffold2592_cov395-Prasinococcus_capsulatus_cf.AAC.9